MAEALFLVERGWRALRECSLDAGRRGVAVTYLIKGSLSPEVRAMVGLTPLMRAVDVPRSWFYVTAWWCLIAGALSGRLRWVVCDHERTLAAIKPWAQRLGVTPVLIRELADGMELSVEGRVVPLEELCGLKLITVIKKNDYSNQL